MTAHGDDTRPKPKFQIMQVQVSRDGNGCAVQISVVSQKGESLSSMQKVVDNFTKALRNRAPDVAVSSP